MGRRLTTDLPATKRLLTPTGLISKGLQRTRRWNSDRRKCMINSTEHGQFWHCQTTLQYGSTPKVLASKSSAVSEASSESKAKEGNHTSTKEENCSLWSARRWVWPHAHWRNRKDIGEATQWTRMIRTALKLSLKNKTSSETAVGYSKEGQQLLYVPHQQKDDSPLHPATVTPNKSGRWPHYWSCWFPHIITTPPIPT